MESDVKLICQDIESITKYNNSGMKMSVVQVAMIELSRKMMSATEGRRFDE